MRAQDGPLNRARGGSRITWVLKRTRFGGAPIFPQDAAIPNPDAQ